MIDDNIEISKTEKKSYNILYYSIKTLDGALHVTRRQKTSISYNWTMDQ